MGNIVPERSPPPPLQGERPGPMNGHPQARVAAELTVKAPGPDQANLNHTPGCDAKLSRDQTTLPREVTFRILLHCVPEKTKREKSLTLENYPATAIELKQCIQSEYSIPASCQRLYFESALIGDDERLASYRVRDGDTLHVRYNSEGDVRDILGIISSMAEMVCFLESIQPELLKGTLSRGPVTRSVKVSEVKSLTAKYFEPFATERANANRLLFVSNNGLELLHELHTILLRQPWENNPLEMQKLEFAILCVLSNITCSFFTRTLVLRRPTLDAVAQSLLRVELARRTTIEAPRNNYAAWGAVQAEFNSVLIEVLYRAACTICNLAELPECRLQIASNTKILEQFIAVILSPTYKYIASLATIAGMLCLAYSPETHPYLTRPEVTEGVIEACEIHRPWILTCVHLEEESRMDNLLLRYFSAMLFAQLATSSSHSLQREQSLKLCDFVKGFLEKAEYGEIREHEVKVGFVWSTVAPYVRLAYSPDRTCSSATRTDMHSSDAETTRKLQELCVEAGIFSLQNMLSGAPAREILVEEGLVEYVTCLPWCTLPGSRAQERAADLVSALRQKMQLHPPRLGTLTRAKLAAWHFGLERVQAISVHELLAEVYKP